MYDITSPAYIFICMDRATFTRVLLSESKSGVRVIHISISCIRATHNAFDSESLRKNNHKDSHQHQLFFLRIENPPSMFVVIYTSLFELSQIV
jgi:hypothetical protein